MAEAPEIANKEQIDYWNSEAGEKWVKSHAGLDRVFRSVTDSLLRHVEPQPGEALIDIGCGTGANTMALAERVGPRGSVLAVDVSEPLLAMAKSRAEAAGLSQIEFCQADAQAHAFEPGGFDLLASRFGVMFFDDPTAAFANLRLALREGGRLAMMCWAPYGGNAWFELPRNAAIARMGAPPLADTRAPGPMAFAERDYVLEILRGAGFLDCQALEEQIEMTYDGPVEEVAALASNLGPAYRIVRGLSGTAADFEAIAGQVTEEFRAFATPDGVRVPAKLNVFKAVR